jgi:HSP20 family protein
MAESRQEPKSQDTTAGTQSEARPQQTGLASRQQRGLSPYGGASRGELTSPFAFMQRFMREMDSLFGDFGFGESGLPSRWSTGGANMWQPQIDVTTRDGQLLVHADLPGLKQEDVKVSVHDGVLTISGERQDKHEENRGGVYRRERSYGSFSRQIALPEGVDPEAIKASFESGVLEVTMPMPKETSPRGRSIPIQAKPASGPDVH